MRLSGNCNYTYFPNYIFLCVMKLCFRDSIEDFSYDDSFAQEQLYIKKDWNLTSGFLLTCVILGIFKFLNINRIIVSFKISLTSVLDLVNNEKENMVFIQYSDKTRHCVLVFAQRHWNQHKEWVNTAFATQRDIKNNKQKSTKIMRFHFIIWALAPSSQNY